MARLKDENGQLATEPELNGPAQVVAYTSASVASAAFNASTSSVILVATTDCHIAYGAAPTAAATTMFLPAKTVLRASVRPGLKIAVIQDAAGGSLYIQECF